MKWPSYFNNGSDWCLEFWNDDYFNFYNAKTNKRKIIKIPYVLSVVFKKERYGERCKFRIKLQQILDKL